jgi:glutamate racemase
MEKHPLKMLIVACNSAASYSHQELPNLCPFPVINVIEAGVRSVVRETTEQCIAVLGTRGTIRSGIYEKEILKKLPDAQVISIACPLLAPLIEEQFINHEATKLIIKEYLTPLKKLKIDTILLGCTHYPLVRHFIHEEMGDDVSIVDSANSCADLVSDIIHSHNLGNKNSEDSRIHKFYVSDDPQRFSLAAKNFLGFIPEVAIANVGKKES